MAFMRPPVRIRLAPPKYMETKYITRFIKITFFCSITGFTILNLLTRFTLFTSCLLAPLIWSFYVLCLPFTGGAIPLYPLLISSRFKEYHLEITAVIIACITTSFFLLYDSSFYEKTLITHLLYLIITRPFPYWSIIITAFLPKALTYFYYEKNIPSRSFWYTNALFITTLLSLILFIFISLQELIIISNIHA